MTTADTPMASAFLAWKQAARVRRNQRAMTTTPTGAVLGAVIRYALHLAGFSLLTASGFTLSMTAGLIMAAISCFAFSALAVPQQNKAANNSMERR